MSKKTALVLTGGGARGAYQAGVIKGIAEILGEREEPPFRVIAGVSAGAINAAFLGAQHETFKRTAEGLCRLWGELRAKAVIKTDLLSLGMLGLRWAKDLGVGGLIGSGKVTHLLDSEPLKKLIAESVDFERIRDNVHSGKIDGIGFTATNYRTGTAVTFFDGKDQILPWARSSRIGRRAHLQIEHVLASASIPVFFKPVAISGTYWGDGGIRLGTPISPAIHMGADRVIAVGIRYPRSDAQVFEMNESKAPDAITLADIGGVLMNALFLDALDQDVERMERINSTLDLLPPEKAAKHPSQLRKIPILTVKPSRDLGGLAADQFSKFPAILRYLLKGTGASQNKGWDLLSYLAFDSSYTGMLIEVGYQDALARKDEILAFMS